MFPVMRRTTRRQWLHQAAALGAVSPVVSGFPERRAAAREGRQASEARGQDAASSAIPDTTRFFPGFKPFRVKTSGAEINGVIGGQGPPLLLLHGAPQMHITWRLVAPTLAREYTVVVPDLRGYGFSSKPPDGENHANYSKRAMALDQVEVMEHFGFERFPVIGQDRGGRVGHRMALDHEDRVTQLAVLDIIPTYYLYTHVTLDFVQAYYHWFSYLRRAPIPENELQAAAAAQAGRERNEVQQVYYQASSHPDNIHAMCEDYRAGASIDVQHDAADIGNKIACPLRVLWAEKGAMGRLYEVMDIWRERGRKVSGRSLPGGHNLQEDVPEMVIDEIQSLVRG
jgi:haloacetate dehalogenase